MAYKYANDLVTIKSQQTFSVEPYFYKAESKNEESPLPIVSSTSRFRATIINKERKAVTVRWTTSEVRSMEADFTTARSLAKQQAWSISENTPTDPAYTVKIIAGSLKGLTPAEVVLQGREKELNNHYKWLKDNLEKYPKNEEIMNAIQNAAALKNEGKLENVSSNSLKDMVVFESDIKPLVRQQKDNGKCPVYKSKVIVHPTDTYPVEVILTTFDAPVIKNDNGTLNVVAKEKENEVTNAMRMSFQDFGFVLEEMSDYIRNFKMLNCKACYTDAENCIRENKNN